MGQVRGILLDVDGTLVDSNEAHAQAWVDALGEQGIDVSVDRVRPLIGMGGDKLLPKLTGIEEETERGKKISKRRREIFEVKYLPHLQPTPGAEDLLLALRSRGLRMVVATSAKKEELQGLLRVCGADKLIDEATSSDDAENSKPDPDIVQAALEQIGLPAAEVVMLGDTPYDVESATRAGVGVIAFRCGGWQDKDLAGALAVYENPADLLKKMDSSPIGT